ncbi:MAG: cytochrome c [Acidobacteria bacterium]|nr:cytochrome c [Acidobacteriota bacterium]
MKIWRRGCILVIVFMFSFPLGAAPQGDKASNGKNEAKGDAVKGKTVFLDRCEICHNADSEEAKVGPGLKGISHKPPHKMADGREHKDHTPAVLREQIVDGSSIMPPEGMPPMGPMLSGEEIDDVVAYLQTL